MNGKDTVLMKQKEEKKGNRGGWWGLRSLAAASALFSFVFSGTYNIKNQIYILIRDFLCSI